MGQKANVLKVGATRKGKTLSAARDVVASTDEAAVILDPHKQSLAEAVLIHATGNLLYDKLSDMHRTLAFDLLSPSTSPGLQQQLENQQRAEAFVEILLRRRGSDGLATTPLMEEWTLSAITLFLFQARPKPLTWLPCAFLPGTDEFAALVRDCTLPEIRYKFQQLAALPPRAQRAEVGSAVRLLNAVFRSPAFQARCRGGFNLGAFLQQRGILILERGEDVGDETMRTIMGAVVLLVIEHAKRRPKPTPPVRIYIDEATNARLVGAPELRGLAETNKNGLYWTFLVQNMDFPGGSDAIWQNCVRHEIFGCPNYALARQAAVDISAGLRGDGESRAERIASLTTDIMNLPAGWRWVRDPSGSRKEYVPLLQNAWPDWPGLREAKLRLKLQEIYARREYGVPALPPSQVSSNDTPSRPSSSQPGSSPAERWRRGRKKQADGLSSGDDRDASA